MLFFIDEWIESPASVPKSYGDHHVKHTISPDDISALFSEALEKFETILGQPTDSYLVELYEVLSKILLVILYDYWGCVR